ncbi:uncharacterized protein LOC120640442 isoform X22 [Panicum virgatum]|uniref:uncharacterized protein LOC120640442 isoform X22 n=1 Tax=Panicum virgatum TaxID=38727 RepID=UPI0019D5EFB8|nr:uncharacterized protein LOC120640442 isoform X22 [Panicum virgatum]
MGRVSFTASAPVLFAPLLSSGSNLLCSRPSALQACSVSPGVACFPFLLLSSGGLPLRHILGDCLLLQFVRSLREEADRRPGRLEDPKGCTRRSEAPGDSGVLRRVTRFTPIYDLNSY